jgi:hypothetical protein
MLTGSARDTMPERIGQLVGAGGHNVWYRKAYIFVPAGTRILAGDETNLAEPGFTAGVWHTTSTYTGLNVSEEHASSFRRPIAGAQPAGSAIAVAVLASGTILQRGDMYQDPHDAKPQWLPIIDAWVGRTTPINGLMFKREVTVETRKPCLLDALDAPTREMLRTSPDAPLARGWVLARYGRAIPADAVTWEAIEAWAREEPVTPAARAAAAPTLEAVPAPRRPVRRRDTRTISDIRIRGSVSGRCSWAADFRGSFDMEVPVDVIEDGLEAVEDYIRDNMSEEDGYDEAVSNYDDYDYDDHATDDDGPEGDSVEFGDAEEIVDEVANEHDDEEEPE